MGLLAKHQITCGNYIGTCKIDFKNPNTGAQLNFCHTDVSKKITDSELVWQLFESPLNVVLHLQARGTLCYSNGCVVILISDDFNWLLAFIIVCAGLCLYEDVYKRKEKHQ